MQNINVQIYKQNRVGKDGQIKKEIVPIEEF